MPRYIIIDENTPECEWETFKSGGFCNNEGKHCIVDTHDDMESESGFHLAHLCDDHIKKGFILTASRFAEFNKNELGILFLGLFDYRANRKMTMTEDGITILNSIEKELTDILEIM